MNRRQFLCASAAAFACGGNVSEDGVTGWVDCGSVGANNIDQIAAAARAAPQIDRVLVNISRTGNAPDGELMDWKRCPNLAPALPTSAMQQVGGYLKYSGRGANVVVGAVLDPDVWSGRASQEVSSMWQLCGLASMYPASDWSGLCSGPSWISARLRSH